MVKKHVKKLGESYKKTFTRTGAKHEPEDHHIATMLIMLLLIILLLCGVIVFLIQENLLIKDAYTQANTFNSSTTDFTVYEYSLAEFSEVTGYEINTVSDLENYMYDLGFEAIQVTENRVTGETGAGCYEDTYRQGQVCRTLRVTYEPTTDEKIQIIEYRDLLPN